MAICHETVQTGLLKMVMRQQARDYCCGSCEKQCTGAMKFTVRCRCMFFKIFSVTTYAESVKGGELSRLPSGCAYTKTSKYLNVFSMDGAYVALTRVWLGDWGSGWGISPTIPLAKTIKQNLNFLQTSVCSFLAFSQRILHHKMLAKK